ncbi:effector-associated domain EAD1-containing protein [Actinosynnema sp. NPDC050801]|uniref:effector-associated domain EAD1-containing protein n=1 Tax=unclassified Actinosynnema TaxID=2637065 RepID=UPI003406E202
MNPLDAFQYPFDDRVAQQLHRTLTTLYPKSQAVQLVARQAGLDMAQIDSEQPPTYLWMDALTQAAAEGRTRALVTAASKALADVNPAKPFLADLLADRPTRLSSEPVSATGQPVFDDHVTEPEALLYQDDLTIQIGRVPGLTTTLERLVAVAPAVCLLNVWVGGDEQYGTGFRIGEDLLLTNWHVLHNSETDAAAATVTAEFGFEDDGRGGIVGATQILCDATDVVSDKDDDWAVIRMTTPLDERWPIIIPSRSVAPAKDGQAFVVQPPGVNASGSASPATR